MSETCTLYPERSDYRENEIWKQYIGGEELPEQEETKP